MLETLELWTRILDEGYGIDVIYLDYRKAFDTVPHKRLLEKAKRLGIDGKLLICLEQFLHDRVMRVQVNGSFSDCSEFSAEYHKAQSWAPCCSSSIGCSKKTDTQFYFWDNFGNSACGHTIKVRWVEELHVYAP